MTTCRPLIARIAFLACLWLALAAPARAVAPGHLWSEPFGGAGYDVAYAAVMDADNNIYVTGAFEGQVAFAATNLTSAGNRDMFLVKLDANGAVVWAVGLGGSGNEYGLSVAVSPLGNNVYVTGTHYTMPGLTSAGANDGYVASFRTLDGLLVMSKGFGGALGDAGQSIAITTGGNILLTGYFTGSINFGGGVLTSASPTASDIFVASLTSTGAHLWSRRCGGTLNDAGREIATDASGSAFVTGEFRGTADFGGSNLVSAGDSDVFLLKYDGAGNLLWKQRYGAALADMGNSVAADGNGGVFVAGSFGGTVNFGGAGLASAGGTDIFLARFNAGGVHQWSARFGGAGADAGTTLTSAGGNAILGGSIQGAVDFGGGGVTAAGATDGFVAKFNAAGTHQWSRGMGGASDDIVQGVATDVSDNTCVAGQFLATANFGGSDLVSAGDNDAFVALYDNGPPTAVHESPAARGLTISNFPNPFNPATTVTYTVPFQGEVKVGVYDARGSLVTTLFDGKRTVGTYSIDWDGRADNGGAVASGVYFVRVEQAGRAATKKMVLLK